MRGVSLVPSSALSSLSTQMASELNEHAFIEAEQLLRELTTLQLRAREVAAIVRREEGPEEVAVAIEAAVNAIRTASTDVSGLVYASFTPKVTAVSGRGQTSLI